MDALAREARHDHARRTAAAPLALTLRDLAILEDLHRHRLMTTRQLQTLYGTRVGRRLTRLHEHGYVDLPPAQRIWRLRDGGGSHPRIFALGTSGARALAARARIAQEATDWTEKNRELRPWVMPHFLAVAEVHVAFRMACARTPLLRLLSAEEIARSSEAHRLFVPGRTQPLYPDLILAIGGGRTVEPSLFFIEVDRSTEPNLRQGLSERQSLRKKFDAYLAYARAKRHRTQFGVQNFRVLTISNGGDRKVANLAATAHDACAGVGVGRFLVTRLDALVSQDPLAPIWRDAEGTLVRLLP